MVFPDLPLEHSDHFVIKAQVSHQQCDVWAYRDVSEMCSPSSASSGAELKVRTVVAGSYQRIQEKQAVRSLLPE